MIASQLAPDLTKLLVISDPLRLKTVNLVSVRFHVPCGVQMMSAFITSKELHILRNSSIKVQNSFTNNNPNLLPFTLSKRKSVNKESFSQKRDKSLIFTNIPEEDSMSEQQINNVKSKIRPINLSLRLKNITSKDLPESGISSINFDEFSDSFPEFIGRTSVCSTPMTENKVLHGNLLSICSNKCDELEILDIKEYKNNEHNVRKARKVIGTPKKIKLANKVTETISVDFELNKEKAHQNYYKSYINEKNLPIDSYNYLSNPYKFQKRRNSWDSLHKIRTKLNLFNTYSGNKPKPLIFNKVQDVDCDTDTEFIDDYETKPSRSITDPTFPVFKSTGDPISISLFEEFLEYHYTNIIGGTIDGCQKSDLNAEYGEHQNNKLSKVTHENVLQNSQKLCKEGLSLPLKSWNHNFEAAITSGKTSFNIVEYTAKSLQLTPLMAKLTSLAMDKQEESDVADNCVLMPLSSNIMYTRRQSSLFKSKLDNLEKVNLFVCGQQNMTLVMFLEDGAAQEQKLIENLFEICVSKLAKTESQLHQVLNMNVEGASGGEGSYSFIAIENQKWDTVQKIGPWSPHELNTIESMHQDMKRQESFTEMVLKKDENILYGYKCGNVDIFYQQTYNASAGIPPPSDIFGNVGSVSRRRLERDHAIVLL